MSTYTKNVWYCPLCRCCVFFFFFFLLCFLFFFFNDTATTEIYTLSLHDALPIYCGNECSLHIGGSNRYYYISANSCWKRQFWLVTFGLPELLSNTQLFRGNCHAVFRLREQPVTCSNISSTDKTKFVLFWKWIKAKCSACTTFLVTVNHGIWTFVCLVEFCFWFTRFLNINK